MKKSFICKFCNHTILTTYYQYKENPYCTNCLDERLNLTKKVQGSIKTFGSYRPLKKRIKSFSRSTIL